MNKKIIVVGILILFTCSAFSLYANKKKEMWSKAIVEKDPAKKLQYLKEYEAEFGQKKDKNNKFLYLNLSRTAFALKSYDEAITYGEKALTFPELDDTNRIQTYIQLASAHRQTKTNIDKAVEYAEKVIQMADEFIKKQETATQDEEKRKKVVENYNSFYKAPALRLQSIIYFEKDKENVENVKMALEKAIAAYELDSSERSSSMIFSFSYNLAKKNVTAEAIKGLETIYNTEKPEHKYSLMLASLYYKKKDKAKAAHYYEMAYRVKRTSKDAMRIGQLIQKANPQKGVKFFAEAYLLGGSDKESKAFQYLQHIFFNVLNKDKSAEEKEKLFKAFLNETRTRLGMEPVADEPAPAAPTEEGSGEASESE